MAAEKGTEHDSDFMCFDDSSIISSQYGQVVFHNILDLYYTDCNISFRYTITESLKPSQGDKLCLFKVGWMNVTEYSLSKIAAIPTIECETGSCITLSSCFSAKDLANIDTSELYHICYLTTDSKVVGASVPFGFRQPGADDLISVENKDNVGLVHYRSRISVLLDRIYVLEEMLDEEKSENKNRVSILEGKLNSMNLKNKELTDLLNIYNRETFLLNGENLFLEESNIWKTTKECLKCCDHLKNIEKLNKKIKEANVSQSLVQSESKQLKECEQMLQQESIKSNETINSFKVKLKIMSEKNKKLTDLLNNGKQPNAIHEDKQLDSKNIDNQIPNHFQYSLKTNALAKKLSIYGELESKIKTLNNCESIEEGILNKAKEIIIEVKTQEKNEILDLIKELNTIDANGWETVDHIDSRNLELEMLHDKYKEIDGFKSLNNSRLDTFVGIVYILNQLDEYENLKLELKDLKSKYAVLLLEHNMKIPKNENSDLKNNILEMNKNSDIDENLQMVESNFEDCMVLNKRINDSTNENCKPEDSIERNEQNLLHLELKEIENKNLTESLIMNKSFISYVENFKTLELSKLNDDTNYVELVNEWCKNEKLEKHLREFKMTALLADIGRISLDESSLKNEIKLLRNNIIDLEDRLRISNNGKCCEILKDKLLKSANAYAKLFNRWHEDMNKNVQLLAALSSSHTMISDLHLHRI